MRQSEGNRTAKPCSEVSGVRTCRCWFVGGGLTLRGWRCCCCAATGTSLLALVSTRLPLSWFAQRRGRFRSERARSHSACPSTAALGRLRPRLPRVAALLEEVEDDLLAFYAFPGDDWTKLRSTNPLERVNREIGRGTDVVGIFPNDRSLIRLAASVVIEQNDEWLVGRRYLSNHSLETILDQEQNDGNNNPWRMNTPSNAWRPG